MMKRYGAFVFLLLLLSGCDDETTAVVSQKETASPSIPFQTLIQTGVSGVEKAEEGCKILKDAQDLRLFYPKIDDAMVSSIDFGHETLLGVYGGDGIRIVGLEPKDACTVVHVEIKRFSETSPFYGIPYSPMHLVKVEGAGGCFRFEESVVVTQ